MPETWPPSLPVNFQISGYQRTVADGRIRSSVDSGVPKVRRRTTASAGLISGSMVFSSAQKVTFEDFFEVTTLGGTLPFNMPDQENGGTHLVRFGEQAPTVSRFAHEHWLVSFTLEALP